MDRTCFRSLIDTPPLSRYEIIVGCRRNHQWQHTRREINLPILLTFFFYIMLKNEVTVQSLYFGRLMPHISYLFLSLASSNSSSYLNDLSTLCSPYLPHNYIAAFSPSNYLLLIISGNYIALTMYTVLYMYIVHLHLFALKRLRLAIEGLNVDLPDDKLSVAKLPNSYKDLQPWKVAC